LPGPNTGCLQILEKKFAQMRKKSAFFQKYVFTAINDKIRIKMSCLEIFTFKEFIWVLYIYNIQSISIGH
jgi:hypothetical protein